MLDTNGVRSVEDQIVSLTVQIVSAHVAANDVSPVQLPVLIREVHRALATVGQPVIEPPKAEPAVSAKKSVFADHIVCLDCGQGFKMLKRHIAADHGLTPEQYRTKWGLSHDYPMVAAEYAAERSKMAVDSGLGKRAPFAPAPKKRGRPTKG
jgi:predicted transcriptional regulator